MTATGNELVTLNQLKLYGGGHLRTHEAGFRDITVVEPDLQEKEEGEGVSLGFVASDESPRRQNLACITKPGLNGEPSIICGEDTIDRLKSVNLDHMGLVFLTTRKNIRELDDSRCGIGLFSLPSDSIYLPTETDELRLTFTNGEFVEGVATDGDFNLYLGIGES